MNVGVVHSVFRCCEPRPSTTYLMTQRPFIFKAICQSSELPASPEVVSPQLLLLLGLRQRLCATFWVQHDALRLWMHMARTNPYTAQHMSLPTTYQTTATECLVSKKSKQWWYKNFKKHTVKSPSRRNITPITRACICQCRSYLSFVVATRTSPVWRLWPMNGSDSQLSFDNGDETRRWPLE